MEDNSVQPTIADFMQLLTQQQAQFQHQLQEQITANTARMEALASKPPAARKAEPPMYNGGMEEDLELWIFRIEQYYADYYPQMQDDSPAFVTMVSCHLGPTPMNFYRQLSIECQQSGVVKTWSVFTNALRKRFLPPDFEFFLREKLHSLTQDGSIHEYVAAFQDILVQCRVPISPMEVRFYFQAGLRDEVSKRLREHHPATLDECVEIALRYDHPRAAAATTSTVLTEVRPQLRPAGPSHWVQRLDAGQCVHGEIGCAVCHFVVGADVVAPLGDSQHVGENAGFAILSPETRVFRSAVIAKLGDDHGAVADDREGLESASMREPEARDQTEIFRLVVCRLGVGEAHRRRPLNGGSAAKGVRVDHDGAGASWAWIATRPAIEEEEILVGGGEEFSRHQWLVIELQALKAVK